jgi:hypothetical protein
LVFLARRLVARGVRFVQLDPTNWDSHGGRAKRWRATSKSSAAKPTSAPPRW